jgi:Small protein A (tmRNA-binding)
VVPYYICQQETFPNAVSGSGYIISQDQLARVFNSGLKVPFLTVEDVSITGLAASSMSYTPEKQPMLVFHGQEKYKSSQAK